MKSDKRTLRAITKEIVDHPFLPILFISEAIKESAVYFLDVEPILSYSVLAVVFTILWVFSDSIDIEEGSIIGEDNE